MNEYEEGLITIVPALPGFQAVAMIGETKERSPEPITVPIIAWRVHVGVWHSDPEISNPSNFNHMATPVTPEWDMDCLFFDSSNPLDDHDYHPSIIYPDGRVVEAGLVTFDNLEDYKTTVLKRRKKK